MLKLFNKLMKRQDVIEVTQTPPVQPSPSLHSPLIDRLYGSIFLGAIGDAYGYVIEFKTIEEIRYAYEGILPFDDIEIWHDNDGLIIASDDTQMTLFTAEGIANAQDDFEKAGTGGLAPMPAIVSNIRYAYLDWLATQRTSKPLSTEESRLLGHREMYFCRAPGNTCLGALHAGGGAFLEPGEVINDSMGCGGVMRIAPIAFIPSLSFAHAYELGCKAAQITHGHPMGIHPSGMLVYILKAVSQGAGLAAAVEASLNYIRPMPGTENLVTIIVAAMKFSGRTSIEPEEIMTLGGGWVGHECLAISLAAALMDASIEKRMEVAANHSGDSDSTAAITGQLIGAQIGYSGLETQLPIFKDAVHRLDLGKVTNIALKRFTDKIMEP